MDKKKLVLILFSSFVLGLLLRLINIDKPEGMWNDEYLTWEIAKASFPKEFFYAIAQNCHAPLHYLYLKLWMTLFNDSDFSLRISSLVPGVLSVFIMFFAGMKFGKKHNDSIGLTAGFLTAISAFLIYFSQEVRIYSLLFFLSSLNIVCTLKTLDNPSKRNCTMFVLSSLLVMLEHTIGFVFVFFSLLSLILFAEGKKNKFKKYLLTSFLLAIIIFIPVLIFIYKIMFNQEYWSQWWAPFSFSKLAFFFTDIFTPRVINITNAPPLFLKMLFNGDTLNFGFLLFVIIPLAIASGCALKAVISFDKKVKYALLTGFGVYIAVLAASFSGKIVFLTKYMTEIIPLFILLFASGFVSIKTKGLKIFLGTLYTVLTLFFILFSQLSPVNLVREEGQKIPVTMLNSLGFKESDRVVFLYYPKSRVMKYSTAIAEGKNVSHISKYDFSFIDEKSSSPKEVFKSGKDLYRVILANNENKPLNDFLNNNVYSKMQAGDKFFFMDFLPVSFLPQEYIQRIVQDDVQYNKMPFLFMVFSYLKNYILNDASSKLEFKEAYEKYSWKIYVFEKK